MRKIKKTFRYVSMKNSRVPLEIEKNEQKNL